MSRDWTPREHLIVEISEIEKGGKPFYEHDIKWIDAVTKKETALFSQEEVAFRKNYRLFGMIFERIYSLAMAHEQSLPRITNVYAEIEMMLEEIVKEPCKQREGFEETVRLWYRGELDEGFYYRERNDDMLCDAILARAGIQPNTE